MPSPSAKVEPWTTRRLLTWMSETFASKGIESPRLCAEILLGHVFECERLRLYTDPERPANAAELGRLRELVARALKHEPVQYLIGESWFFGLPMTVDRRVLVPRPCTEGIVEWVLQDARRRSRETGEPKPLAIADVCTGSGCIAAALAKNMPDARIIATDISGDALVVAVVNATRHGVADRIEFRAGDLVAPLQHEAGSLDYLVANPPYIPDHEWAEVPANVKEYEPHSALRGGQDGLAFVRPLVADAPRLLRPGGHMLIEIAASTADSVLSLTKDHAELDSAVILNDLEGLPRSLLARRC